MSILIKGMEMPISCWDCPLLNTSPCACKGYSTALEHTTNRHPDCPLVPVPPHGDLIDQSAYRDEFMDGVYDLCNDDPDNYRVNAIIDLFDDAPTIIPAEEGDHG